MTELKGSKTEQNLMTAFLGEGKARNKYMYFSGIARKEGYRQIAEAFEETANHEGQHAKRFYKFLEGGDVRVEYDFGSAPLSNTLENLKDAAGGEHHEHADMYPEFAAIAREEGFTEIADVFEAVAIAEIYHEKRFKAFIKNIENDSVFKKETKIIWRCMNCGYNHEGESAPDKCPACDHVTAHFEVLAENW